MRARFDRSPDFAELEHARAELAGTLDTLNETQARRRLAQLRREFSARVAIDYFPGDAQARAADALQALAFEIDRRYSGHEPRATAAGRTQRLRRQDHRGRIWATRKHLWVIASPRPG